jgi:hypothetical protein
MLATVASTPWVGDQLWIKLCSPPSTGKTVLAEAISTAKRFVLAKSTVRGFHSGYKTDGGGEDNSLLALCNGMTLVTKDGDTLLQSPNLGQILAEGRDIYDRVSRTHYRNKTSRDYEGISLTWILCGTSSLRAIDQSELGQRFLDCVIMDHIDEDLERAINLRKGYQAVRNMGIETNGDMSSHDSIEMVEMKRIVGGYVEHLRDNPAATLRNIDYSDDYLLRTSNYAKFIAMLRARPSIKQDEHDSREMSTRLMSQLTRLAMCTAYVINSKTVDAETMRRVNRTTMDTARGKTLDIVKLLHEEPKGLEPKTVVLSTAGEDAKTRHLLKFMHRIKIAETFQPIRMLKGGGKQKTGGIRYRLTESMRELYDEVTREI